MSFRFGLAVPQGSVPPSSTRSKGATSADPLYVSPDLLAPFRVLFATLRGLQEHVAMLFARVRCPHRLQASIIVEWVVAPTGWKQSPLPLQIGRRGSRPVGGWMGGNHDFTPGDSTGGRRILSFLVCSYPELVMAAHVVT